MCTEDKDVVVKTTRLSFPCGVAAHISENGLVTFMYIEDRFFTMEELDKAMRAIQEVIKAKPCKCDKSCDKGLDINT